LTSPPSFHVMTKINLFASLPLLRPTIPHLSVLDPIISNAHSFFGAEGRERLGQVFFFPSFSPSPLWRREDEKIFDCASHESVLLFFLLMKMWERFPPSFVSVHSEFAQNASSCLTGEIIRGWPPDLPSPPSSCLLYVKRRAGAGVRVCL